MDFIQSLLDHIAVLSKNNQMVAGAVSLWGLTVITWVMRHVPATLWTKATSQIKTSLIFNNSGYEGNDQQFKAFMAWFTNSPWAKWSRYMSLDGNDYGGSKIVVGPGYGRHFFWYKGRFFWFNKYRLPSTGSNNEKQEIEIKALGRNQQCIIDLIEDFRHKPDDSKVGIYTFKEGKWEWLTEIPKRDIRTVILEPKLKQKLLDDLDHFFANEQWYTTRGMAYKLTQVLCGLPGTGKTSIIKALASHYGKSICTMNISSMTDATFELALTRVPRNSFVLIEDFDSAAATKNRGTLINEIIIDPFEMLSLSKILNTLDGVVSLNGTVIFMTTNHLDQIDPALVRKGRVDHCHEIPYLADPEVRQYIDLMFPGHAPCTSLVFADLAGCDLQHLFMENRDDLKGFVKAIPKKVCNQAMVS